MNQHAIYPVSKASTPKGKLPLVLGGRLHQVVGGPFGAVLGLGGLPAAFSVKLEARAPAPATLTFPIPDFGIPDDPQAFLEAVQAALTALLRGRPVFVGCAGGMGRTGLFLAAMAKVVGVADPVAYVRDWYHPGAVETRAQESFLAGLDTGAATRKLVWKSWSRRLGFTIAPQ